MWQAERPSNIALIKYMGKKNIQNNTPSNASLSWTLQHLKTTVTLEPVVNHEDCWEALPSDFPFVMSKKGRNKYLAHFKRLKDYFGVSDNYKIRSGNNFPADCGIASSASSFAALTEVACQAFKDIKNIDVYQRAQLSALGSGSSCRSFLPDWVLWDGEKISQVESPFGDLIHMVVIVGDQAKAVTSSEAHKFVSTSALFEGRTERAEQRLKVFSENMQSKNWPALYEIAWSEFWDMHALFETSNPAFGYFLSGSIEVQSLARNFWQQKGDGPLVTMDAGPNVHLLWRRDQCDLFEEFETHFIKNKWQSISNFGQKT